MKTEQPMARSAMSTFVNPPLRSASGASRLLRRGARNDNGFVMAFFGIFLTVLVSVGGFAVDVGNWYLHALRLQRAADSAALAGSVYMPNDFTSAKTTAQNTLVSNGESVNAGAITQVSTNPSELKVALTETVNNYFTSLLGYKTITLNRNAIAQYSPYVPMGSPSNVLGVEPSTASPCPISTCWEKSQDIGLQDHYWLNIAAAGTLKANGDRYNGGVCDPSTPTDNCNVSTPAPYGNTDYTAEGQAYVLRINAGTTGKFVLQAFDPGFAYVGDQCDVSTINDGSNPQYNGTTHTGLATWGNTNPACTGDQMVDSTKLPPNTTYQIYTPASSPGGSQLITTAGCTAVTYAGYKGQIASKLSDQTFSSWFRQWTPLCTLNLGSQFPPGDYLLHVSTGTDTAYNGLNRYALRAGIVNGDGSLNSTATQNLSLFSQGRLVIFAHDQTGDVTFFIARIQSGAAGHTMTVTLFDIGDATGGANLSLLPPTDATWSGGSSTTFPNCQYTPPTSSIYQNMASGCAINGITSATYNGRIVNIKVVLPSDYACNDPSADGCWTRLKLHYGAGSVADTTSWEVGLNGNPVHLVAEGNS